jgi:hypothetical protein
MPATVQIDARAMQRFSGAVQQLAKMSGKNFEPVIRHELAAVLTGAVRGTKKASVTTIRENARKQHGVVLYDEPYEGPQSYSGQKYSKGQASRLTQRANERRGKSQSGGLVYYLPASREPKKYPNWLWKKIQEKRARQLSYRLGARGLAAKMWLHIGDQLRMAVKAPGYVRNAKTKKGDLKQATQVFEGGRGAQYSVGFVNALTKTNPHARAGLAFRNALNARANYFAQSMKLRAKGVIKEVFDRYPNLGRFS